MARKVANGQIEEEDLMVWSIGSPWELHIPCVLCVLVTCKLSCVHSSSFVEYPIFRYLANDVFQVIDYLD